MMKNNKAFSIVLGFFLVACFGRNTVYARTDFDKMKELETKEKGVPDDEKITITLKPSAAYTASGLRDPFEDWVNKTDVSEIGISRKTEEEKPLPELKVQGVIIGRVTQAIINNKFVKPNDVIDGVTIVSIDREKITLLFENKQYTIESPISKINTGKKSQGGNQ
jgi:hypothetical protein